MAFDFNAWAVRFPELATRGTASRITALAAEAPTWFDFGQITDVTRQDALLNLFVAHLVELYLPRSDSPAGQGLVGRVTSASEGSVSVSLDAGQTVTLTQSWFMQSRYGHQFWVQTGFLRTFRYVPGYPRRRPILNRMP